MDYIGITMGDPAGVGPEIIIKALSNENYKIDNAVVYGSKDVLLHYIKKLNVNMKINQLESIKDFKEGEINLFNIVNLSMEAFNIGEVSPICGDAAFKYVERAIKDALNKDIKAVVTAPLNKEALHLGGHNYDGHTEIFARLTNTPKYSMMLIGGGLRVIHVSTHTSLKNACMKVKKERILEVINLAEETLKKIGINNPKIAVAGLNPHSGEGGIFGREEIEEITPAIEMARANGVNVKGPIAPDTVFIKGFKGLYDVVVAMYHDQGHIPMKLLAFDTGVNMTVGLPIIRTSVDHGTAFDIAGKNKASEKSLIEAIKVANAALI